MMSMLYRAIVWTSVVLVALATVSGCKPPSPPVTNTVGPEGGEVVQDGARLDVPAGALTEPVEIGLKVYASPENLPMPGQGLAFGIQAAVELLPEGLTFLKPATLTIPVATPVEPGDETILYQWLPGDGVWGFTEFPAVANAAGDAYVATIDHFSILGPGNGGVFSTGNLPPWRYMELWRQRFCDGAYPPGKSVFGEGCCLEIGSYDLYVDYESETESVHDTDHCGRPKVDAWTDEIVMRTRDGRGVLRAVVHVVYADVDHLFLDATNRQIDLDGQRSTTLTLDMYCQAGEAIPGGARFAMEVEGSGSVSPSTVTVGPGGRAMMTYSAGDAEEPETVTIRATQLGCRDSSGGTISAERTVSLYRDEWHGVLEIAFDQPWPDASIFSSFSDVLIIDVFFTFDPTGTVTGSGAGTHTVAFGAGDCGLTGIAAPSFDAIIGGTLSLDGIELTVNAAGMVVNGTFDCGEGDIVTIPHFGTLENMILTSHIRPKLPLQKGASDEGAGSEDFGDDVPMSYAWTFTLEP